MLLSTSQPVHRSFSLFRVCTIAIPVFIFIIWIGVLYLVSSHSESPVVTLNNAAYLFRGTAEKRLQRHTIFIPTRDGQPMTNIKNLKKSLDRVIEDFRPKDCKKVDYTTKISNTADKLSVIIVFSDEPKENLLRTIHSVINRTSMDILEEVLLVDDMSLDPYISLNGDGFLQTYIDQLPKVRMVRTDKRLGIVGARLLGIRSATGSVFAILDSHVEVGYNWAEPLLFRVAEDPTRIVMPAIDSIDSQSYQHTKGGIGCVLGVLWRVVEHGIIPSLANPSRMNVKPTDFVTSPTMAGGLFAANRDFFLKIGGYDTGITYWGAENLELSFRWWQCGGVIECSSCSRVAHIFGGYRGYTPMQGSSLVRNKLRTAAVWMDEYSDFVWKMMGKPSINIGDISSRIKLREELKCKSFKWFLTEVWPESDIQSLPEDVPNYGFVENMESKLCLTNGQDRLSKCDTTMVYFRKPGRITPQRDEEVCLTVSTFNDVTFASCYEDRPSNQRFVYDAETKQIINGGNKCLESVNMKLALNTCDLELNTQRWMWDAYEFEKNLPWTIPPTSTEG